MSPREPATRTARRSRSFLAAFVLVGAALLVGLGYPSLAAAPSSATSSIGPLGTAAGVVRDDASVFDDGLPAVANLDPDLLRALRRAATAAADERVELRVNSGWRSRRYQAELLREAISKYGSKEEAARWVATPDTSAHVSGDAVDIGHSDAEKWLSEHGADYGLCQIYRNEPWHFELRPDAVHDGCPAQYADSAHDPRMHK